jgi:chromosome segregation ATPase
VTTPADTTMQAQAIRQRLVQFVPNGFRDEDGVWHGSQHRIETLAALDALVAELDWQEREIGYQLAAKIQAQSTLKAVTDSLDLTFSDLGNGWREALPKILARIETIVDEADRGFRERDEARAELERLREELGEAVARADRLEAVLYPPALNREQKRALKHGDGVHSQFDDSTRQGG